MSVSKPMTPGRRVVANAVILGIALLPFTGKLLNVELWPFSKYSMYATATTEPTFATLRVYGVPRDASAAEIALWDPRYLAPFDNSRLTRVLETLAATPDAAARLRPALADIARRYEQHRAAGDHTGPPLRGLRLYVVAWQVRADAVPIDEPDSRTLIFEWQADQ